MDDADLIQAQDSLRPIRMFVGALTGALSAGDQTYSGVDGWVYNQPGGYQAVGAYGYSVEGKPISTTQSGAIVISPALVLIGIGAAIMFLAKG